MRTLWRIFAGFFKWTWRLLNFVRNPVMNRFHPPGAGLRGHLDAHQ